jgi:hypothetical protein
MIAVIVSVFHLITTGHWVWALVVLAACAGLLFLMWRLWFVKLQSRTKNVGLPLDEKGLMLSSYIWDYYILWHEVRWYRFADELEFGLIRADGAEVVRRVKYEGLDLSPEALRDILARLCRHAACR